MLTELKHVFEGNLRGFDQEDRQKNGDSFKVDVMVLDEGMTTHRITMKRVDKEDVERTLTPGTPVRVETLVRAFNNALGISFLRVMPAAVKAK